MVKRMHVLHVITTLDLGGAEKQLLVLIEEQIKNGYLVEIAYLKGTGRLGKDASNLGAKIHNLSEIAFCKQIRRLRRITNLSDFNLVHAHLPRAEVATSLLSKSIPKIFSRHNMESFFPAHPGPKSTILARFVYRRGLIVCITQSVHKFLLNTREVSNSSKTFIVPYGFKFEEKLNSKLTKNSLDLKILCVNRLVRQKDVPTILRAVAASLMESKSITLDIVGIGKEKDNLENLCSSLDLKNSVSFLGEVVNIASLYTNYNLTILASLYEGFGLVILESVNSGVPILVSNSDAAVEILGNSYPGIFPIGDDIELSKLIIKSLDMEFRIRLLKAANESLKRFSSGDMFAKMSQVYKQAIMQG